MKTKHAIALTSVVLLPAAACSRPVELEPAQSANSPSRAGDAVTAARNGVQLISQANDWPGAADIDEQVTPMRVIIHNDSDEPIAIRYADFSLEAASGKSYSAIPPARVDGLVDVERVEPGFGYSAFYPAPYYRGYYADMTPYNGPFVYDRSYYASHYGYWDHTTRLPTAEMLQRALPEGVLEPGGNVDGYLYFERVRQEEDTSVTLVAELGSANDDRERTRLSLPFVVE